MSDQKDTVIYLDCPECEEENRVRLSSDIKCHKCQKSLLGFKYIQKPLIKVSTALLIGGLSGHWIDDFFEFKRYPIKIEHSIIENCLSGYSMPLKYFDFKEKREICICALEKTEKKFDYKDLEENSEGFFQIFRENVAQCQ